MEDDLDIENMDDIICPHCGKCITEKDKSDYWFKEMEKTDKLLKDKVN